MPPNDRAGAQRQRSAVPDFIYKEKDKAKNKPKGAVAHPLKNKDRSKSQKRLYNFGLLL
ncbi:MAG: hypothetical protein ACLSUC_13475 [Subdoligranulum sp.]